MHFANVMLLELEHILPIDTVPLWAYLLNCTLLETPTVCVE